MKYLLAFVSIVVLLALLSTSVLAGVINSSVIFYMPANGTASETVFYDLSNNAYPIVTTGDTKIKNANSSWRFKNASYFDGTGDKLTSSPMAANMSGDFTVAFWFNSTSATTWNGLVGNMNTSTGITGAWRIGTRTNAGNVLNLINDNSMIGSSSTNYNDGVWHYLVLIKNGTALNMTVDGVYKINASAGSWKWGALNRDLVLGYQSMDNIYYTGYIDDLVILNYSVANPTIVPSVEFVDSAPVTGVSLNASFTQSANPSVVGQAVTFTDTSTGSPDTWNWSIGGPAITNTTQNATYTFDTAGDYPVYLNVTNATGSFNVTGQTHTVVNASGFAPQDVWMEGQYNVTVHVTDSSSGAQLGNVTITTSDGQSATTNSLGYAYITEAFGVYVFYFSKDGYSSKSVPVAVDEDDTLEVQMTEAASTNNQQNTWYTPHQVRFRVFDGNNAPVVGTAVCATAISSTFPSGSDTSWLTDMYGINPDMANEMLNGTLIMSGTTQSDGSTVFTMHSSIGYNIDVTNPANGVVQSVNVTPIDNYYVIHLVGSAINNTYMQMGYNTTLNVTEPNTSYVTMHVFYQDMSGMTSLAEMYVVDRSNNTVINYQSTVPVGSNWVWMNYTVPNVRGQRYSWYYNGVRTI